MAKKLPKTLYVKLEKDSNSDTSYFVADEDMYGLAEMGERVKIGTYQLIEVTNAEVVLKTGGR